MPFDLVRDFAAVSQMTSQPYCLTVHPGVPAKSVKEYVDLIRATLNRAVLDALKAPEAGPRFALDGSEPVGSTTEIFSAHIRSEIEKYAKVTKDAGMKIE